MITIDGPEHARILGLGHYRPANVITNHDLIERGVDTNDEWIKTRVGIAERRWADPDETVIDMAEAAASKAMATSGVEASDVDFVLVATCTMPEPLPAASPQLATRLGISAPGAYDISSGCSGFVYALAAASAAIRAGQARNVLVVASERFSGWLDMNDRSTCIILGDGAGAAVIGPSDEPAMGPIVWGSDGAQFDSVAIDAETRYFRQEGQAVYRWATSQMGPIALEACERAGIKPTDLEYQAVLGRGWLSPWIEGGKFCGSRGMALPLLGLKVRLKGSVAKTHECSYSATFVDGSSVGPVPGGETCEAETLAALEAFQVVIRRRGGASRTPRTPRGRAVEPAKPAPEPELALTKPAARRRSR